MTLLLGPPSSGKSSLLRALAGKLNDNSLRVAGEVTYNGQPMKSFTPQRTAAYIPQTDEHVAELTYVHMSAPPFGYTLAVRCVKI